MAVTAALRSGTTTETPAEQTAATTGVFLSPTSLTFPVAASVCAALLGLANRFQAGAATNPVWALMVSLVIGAFIIWQGWPMSGDARTKGIHVAIGLLNVLLLTATVLGVTAVATGESIGTAA
jgi:hypothetical protein